MERAERRVALSTPLARLYIKKKDDGYAESIQLHYCPCSGRAGMVEGA
jgi:hypothetical protein